MPEQISLGRLAAVTGGRVVAADGASTAATGITHDSRRVVPGDLFCCVVGENHDGHSFAADAVRAGAAALLVERELEADVAQLVVRCVRSSMGPAANAVWGNPSRRISVVGVTGTAGKTTVAHALGVIARACGGKGERCEVFGTLDGAHTTPEATEAARRLAEAADAGSQMAVMEVSSHALALGRADGIEFAAGVFTNLSHEHLDFHESMEQYFEAKARLFDGRCEIAVVNTADPWGRRLEAIAARAGSAVVGWRPEDVAGLTVCRGGFRGRWRGRDIRCGLIGPLNAANVAAAAATAGALGFDDDAIAGAISRIAPVRGRLWPVGRGPSAGVDEPTVLVDFAHKPAALDAALSASRDLLGAGGRLWAVFGAGGDRDLSKRAPMGAAASRHADVIVLTSDNPRSEDPAAIAAQIAEGINSETTSRAELHVELDRGAAVELAVSQAASADVVVIAGKGHETSQIFADEAVAFDDSEAAGAALDRRRSAQP